MSKYESRKALDQYIKNKKTHGLIITDDFEAGWDAAILSQIQKDKELCKREAKYGNPLISKSKREMYKFGAEACANRISDQLEYMRRDETG